MQCYLCKSEDHKKRDGSVRDNKKLDILECNNCGLVFLSDDKHIDNNFYEESKMHKDFDFSKWRKQTLQDDSRRFEFLKNSISNKTILDFGSGNGGFLNLSKELALDVCGVELEVAVKSYYEKEEIKLIKSLDECKNKYDLITSFHVIEHLKDPINILGKLKDLLYDDGTIIIEVPNANDALLSIYNSESFSHFTYWSCHLYLFTSFTLELLAKKAGLKVEFIKHIQRYPLSNHLYWLSNNKPGGHEKWGSFIDSSELSNAYENQLASLQATDTIIASFKKES